MKKKEPPKNDKNQITLMMSPDILDKELVKEINKALRENILAWVKHRKDQNILIANAQEALLRCIQEEGDVKSISQAVDNIRILEDIIRTGIKVPDPTPDSKSDSKSKEFRRPPREYEG
jgi:hypothetical protein